MKTRRGTKAPMKETCQLDDTPDEEVCYDGDKENEANAVKPRRKGKRKEGARATKKGLSTSLKNNSAENASQESPPIFAFKTTKTSFHKRKKLKLEKQLDKEKNEKRIQELVTYFKNLDEQKLETSVDNQPFHFP